MTRLPDRRSAAGGRVPARTRRALVGAIAIAVLAAAIPRALHLSHSKIDSSTRSADSVVRLSGSSLGAWRERRDTLRDGETLSQVLARAGVSTSVQGDLLRAANTLDARRVRAGMPISVRSRGADSTPGEVVFQLAVDRLLRLRHAGSSWTVSEETLPWTTDTVVVAGVIRSTLYEAMDSAAAFLPRATRAELAWNVADIYEYRVDMSRELQSGDSFRVLVVRSLGPGGSVRIDDVPAARFQLSGSSIDAIRFVDAAGRREYYDGAGRSMRAAFLRAPLQFRRISSRFGLRLHPILGIWRQHAGTDYAAAAGTPVRAIGDGTIIFAGQKGGYGNLLAIRHRNGYVSRYGHLRAFAAGIRPGRAVSIGQTVAYVGMSGLATAPHLHFEILVSGVQRDPRAALNGMSGFPIPASERSRFDQARATLLAALDAAPGGKQVAVR